MADLISGHAYVILLLLIYNVYWMEWLKPIDYIRSTSLLVHIYGNFDKFFSNNYIL